MCVFSLITGARGGKQGMKVNSKMDMGGYKGATSLYLAAVGGRVEARSDEERSDDLATP